MIIKNLEIFGTVFRNQEGFFSLAEAGLIKGK
jgi:hypothetical protein